MLPKAAFVTFNGLMVDEDPLPTVDTRNSWHLGITLSCEPRKTTSRFYRDIVNFAVSMTVLWNHLVLIDVIDTLMRRADWSRSTCLSSSGPPIWVEPRSYTSFGVTFCVINKTAIWFWLPCYGYMCLLPSLLFHQVMVMIYEGSNF